MTKQVCALCGSGNVCEYTLGSELLDLPNHSASRVMRCEQCSIMFLAPYLSEEVLATLYSSSYFSADAISEAPALAPAPRDIYRDAVETRLPKFRSTLALLRKLFPTAQSIMDVGAGTGEFVVLAREAGFKADGLEFSEFAARDAKRRYQVELMVGSLSRFQAPRRYDLVHLNHVFEHLTDPHAAVRFIQQLLARNGGVYVEVPFQFNWIDKLKYLLFQARPSFNIHSLHHPIFFTPKTLVRLFEKHGFQCIHLNLFDRVHYPAQSLTGKLKSWVWRALAVCQQGLFIEAIFRADGPPQ